MGIFAATADAVLLEVLLVAEVVPFGKLLVRFVNVVEVLKVDFWVVSALSVAGEAVRGEEIAELTVSEDDAVLDTMTGVSLKLGRGAGMALLAVGMVSVNVAGELVTDAMKDDCSLITGKLAVRELTALIVAVIVPAEFSTASAMLSQIV